jgi:uncharacterized protein (TIGR02246 family)
MTADERQLRQIVADWGAATAAGEIDRVLSLMTEDAVFLTPGNAAMTKAEFAKASKAQAQLVTRIESRSEIKEVQVAGEWAFMWSHLSVSVTPKQGPPVERVGHTLTVFRRQGDRWLLARDANMLAPVDH